MVKADYTTRDLVRFAKLSKHMVNYLCRYELLKPTLSVGRRRGLRRKFSYADLLLARAIAKLLQAGVSVLSLRRALESLSRKIRKVPLDVFASRNVAIVGSKVYLAEPGETLTDLTADGQLAFQFVLEADRLPAGRDLPASAAPNTHDKGRTMRRTR